MREAQESIPCSSTLLSQKNTLCRVVVIPQLGERFYSIHGYGTIFASSINSVGRVLVLGAKSRGFDPRMEHQFLLCPTKNTKSAPLRRYGLVFSPGRIAQSVERWSNKPLVMGSIPIVLPTELSQLPCTTCFFGSTKWRSRVSIPVAHSFSTI